jgi:hypothetical protein
LTHPHITDLTYDTFLFPDVSEKSVELLKMASQGQKVHPESKHQFGPFFFKCTCLIKVNEVNSLSRNKQIQSYEACMNLNLIVCQRKACNGLCHD